VIPYFTGNLKEPWAQPALLETHQATAAPDSNGQVTWGTYTPPMLVLP